MNARVAFSWIFLLVGGALGAQASYAGQVPTDPLVSALTAGYSWWSIYWGVPVIFPWWRELNFGPAFERRMLKLVLGLVVVTVLGHAYGACGGGFYQLWKHSRK